METPIGVLLVDDHAIVREGLRTVLAEEPDIIVVGEAASGTEALALVPKLAPDVVLLDLLMPDMGGIEVTRRLRAAGAACRVLALTSYAGDGHVHEVLQAGADGFLLKDVLTPDLLLAIRATARGEAVLHPVAQREIMRRLVAPVQPAMPDSLTARERDVLALIAGGQSNKEIATTLHLSVATVKGHISAILGKLGVADRTQAALYAVRHGLGGGEDGDDAGTRSGLRLRG
jgi:DNA-binding NarL/FixJ family response regulator